MGFPAEVVEFEQGRPALAAGGRNHGWVDLPEPLVPEVFVDRAKGGVSDSEDRRHPLGADPEVADVEQELLAQILLDRELLCEVDDLEVVGADLEPTRG